MIQSTGKLLDYSKFRYFSDVFIETGSGHGAGIQRALDAGFLEVASIEAQVANYFICVGRFAKIPNVNIFSGRSTDILHDVLKHYDKRNVIFLDAHPSGPASFGHEEVIHNNMDFSQDTIIRKELDIILQTRTHLIIIDDVNGTADGLAEQYAEIVRERRPLAGYKFFFYDENLNGKRFYKDKLLVCIPEG